MLRYVFLASLGLFATVVSSLAQTPSSDPASPTSSATADSANNIEHMEDPQMGDRWTYEIRDEITGDVKSTVTHTVTDVTGSEISVKFAQVGTANASFQTYDRSWDVVNNGIWRYSPNDGSGVRLPLAVGKTWTARSTDVNSSANVSWKRSVTSKVVAQETVTTRAGTFDTFKIETSIQVQNANDPTKKFQSTQLTWYVPAINHWVKRTSVSRSDGSIRDKSTAELVEYGRRN